ncbi:MAG TPA: hypothetical protein VE866_01775, partial [Candidatus Binatia bacterium]|nr:hypothetical protein [Candidatus Binatia bacterium]
MIRASSTKIERIPDPEVDAAWTEAITRPSGLTPNLVKVRERLHSLLAMTPAEVEAVFARAMNENRSRA